MNVVLTRTNPLVDVRVNTIISAGSAHVVVYVSSDGIQIFGQNLSLCHEQSIQRGVDSLIYRLKRFFQTGSLAAAINAALVDAYENHARAVIAIDVDMMKLGLGITAKYRILDLHENDLVATGHTLNEFLRLAWYKLIARLCIHRYERVITVSTGIMQFIVDKYRVTARVIPNVNCYVVPLVIPPRVSLRRRDLKYVYHGVVSRQRQTPQMLAFMARERHHCTVYVANNDSTLQELRDKYRTSELIVIKDPVPQRELIAELSKYHVGVFLFNQRVNASIRDCLPNKFFEFIYAGLPVIFGPSSAVRSILSRHRVGYILDSWNDFPAVEAQILQDLSTGLFQSERLNFLSEFSLSSVAKKWQEELACAGSVA